MYQIFLFQSRVVRLSFYLCYGPWCSNCNCVDNCFRGSLKPLNLFDNQYSDIWYCLPVDCPSSFVLTFKPLSLSHFFKWSSTISCLEKKKNQIRGLVAAVAFCSFNFIGEQERRKTWRERKHRNPFLVVSLTKY